MKQFINRNSKQHIHEKCLREQFIKMFRCEDIFDSTVQHLWLLFDKLIFHSPYKGVYLQEQFHLINKN